MRQQTLTWLSVLLALVTTLSACGSAAPDAATVPESEAGTSSEEQLSGTISVYGAFALHPMMTVWVERTPSLWRYNLPLLNTNVFFLIAETLSKMTYRES